MRFSLFTLAGLFLCTLAPLQAQNTLSHQGLLTNTDGTPVNDGTYTLTFRLYDAPAGGNTLWTETQTDVEVSDGLFSVLLGTVEALDGLSFDAPYFLSIAVGDDAATELTPRLPLTAAPYALRAQALDDGAIEAGDNVSITREGKALRITAAGDDSGGDITAIIVGEGLSGGGDSGEARVGLDTDFTDGRYVNEGQADGVTGSMLADGAVTLGKIDPSAGEPGQVLTIADGQAAWNAIPAMPAEALVAARGDTLIGFDAAKNTLVLTRETSVAGTIESTEGGIRFPDGTLQTTAASGSTLGTTDDTPVEIQANSLRVLRIEPPTADDGPNWIAGHPTNSVTEGVVGATIGGGGMAAQGQTNRVTNVYGTVSGGLDNSADEMATVGGGQGNEAAARLSTIGGGLGNEATGTQSTIAGGQSNEATAVLATISGGFANDATGIASAILGGQINEASGFESAVVSGQNNEANGQRSAVLAGNQNIAGGSFAVVLGGINTEALGSFSLAFGHRAKVAANHSGAMLFADNNAVDFSSAAADEFAVRASGGVRLLSSDDGASGVRLPAGGSTWQALSDRNAKEHFSPVDGTDVLARVVALPLSTWNYKTQNDAIRHMGPMAQDFYAAFGLGSSQQHITTVDADGVALAAIQGLHAQLQAQQTTIETLQAELAQLRALMARKLAAR